MTDGFVPLLHQRPPLREDFVLRRLRIRQICQSDHSETHRPSCALPVVNRSRSSSAKPTTRSRSGARRAAIVGARRSVGDPHLEPITRSWAGMRWTQRSWTCGDATGSGESPVALSSSIPSPTYRSASTPLPTARSVQNDSGFAKRRGTRQGRRSPGDRRARKT